MGVKVVVEIGEVEVIEDLETIGEEEDVTGQDPEAEVEIGGGAVPVIAVWVEEEKVVTINVEDEDVTALKVAVEMTEAGVEKPVVMAAVVNRDLVLNKSIAWTMGQLWHHRTFLY